MASNVGESPSWRDKMRKLLQEDLDDLHNSYDNTNSADLDDDSSSNEVSRN